MSGFSNSNAIRSDTRLRRVILLSSNEHVDLFTTEFHELIMARQILQVSKKRKEQLKNARKKRTSDAGSQYRCGRVGRGSQPPSTPNAPTNPPSNTHTHKKLLKRSFSHFSTRGHGPTDRRTNGRTKPLIELRVRN